MSMKKMLSQSSRVFWHIISVSVLALVDTWQEAFANNSTQNMNPYVRWELLIVGVVFLGITESIDIQMNWLVLLPLMSIYLISTAMIGYEPLYFLIQKLGSYFHKHWLALKRGPTNEMRTLIAK